MTRTMSTGRERITVLVPAYQHARFIAECLDSILAQVVDADLEVLVGEDGSTDGTRDICWQYASRDPRITMLERPPDQRKIMIEGRMTGRANIVDLMSRASGDYSIRIDGDDRWRDPTLLQKAVDALRADPAAMGCYHRTIRIDDQGRETGQAFKDDLPGRLDLEDTIAVLSPFHVSSFLYRVREPFRTLPDLARWVGSLDMMFFALVAAHGHLLRIPGTMSCYRVHTSGLTRTPLYALSNDHRLRILMWTALVAHLGGRGKEKADRVCDDLLRNAVHLSVTASDAIRWSKAAWTRPSYFLARGYRIGLLLKLFRRGLRAAVGPGQRS